MASDFSIGHNLNTYFLNFLADSHYHQEERVDVEEHTKGAMYALLKMGHMANALFVTPITIIYDIGMSIIYLIANLATAFTFEALRQRMQNHLKSAFCQTPCDIGRNFQAIVNPTAAYNAIKSPEEIKGFFQEAIRPQIQVILETYCANTLQARDNNLCDLTAEDEAFLGQLRQCDNIGQLQVLVDHRQGCTYLRDIAEPFEAVNRLCDTAILRYLEISPEAKKYFRALQANTATHEVTQEDIQRYEQEMSQAKDDFYNQHGLPNPSTNKGSHASLFLLPKRGPSNLSENLNMHADECWLPLIKERMDTWETITSDPALTAAAKGAFEQCLLVVFSTNVPQYIADDELDRPLSEVLHSFFSILEAQEFIHSDHTSLADLIRLRDRVWDRLAHYWEHDHIRLFGSLEAEHLQWITSCIGTAVSCIVKRLDVTFKLFAKHLTSLAPPSNQTGTVMRPSRPNEHYRPPSWNFPTKPNAAPAPESSTSSDWPPATMVRFSTAELEQFRDDTP
jgi:hypothetical protein